MSQSIRAPKSARVRGTLRQPFAIVGYIPFLGARGKVGSLLLALKDEDGAFRFVGAVRKGFTGAMRVQLGELLEKDHVQASPVADAPQLGTLERWAIPRHVADVEFAEWTQQGHVRAPSFQGLREDKRPSECAREDAVREHVRENTETTSVAASDIATVA
jgi:bifunctional non-homologous end joining protein LigD